MFEGGPFTIAARVPGVGEAITKVKVLSGLVHFAARYTLPTLPGPAEGLVAAWDTSPKDGSVICLVTSPSTSPTGANGQTPRCGAAPRAVPGGG